MKRNQKILAGSLVLITLLAVYGIYDYWTFISLQKRCVQHLENEEIFVEVILERAVGTTKLKRFSQEIAKLENVSRVDADYVTSDQVLENLQGSNMNQQYLRQSLEALKANPLPEMIYVFYQPRDIVNSVEIINDIENIAERQGIEIDQTQLNDNDFLMKNVAEREFDYLLFRPASGWDDKLKTRNIVIKSVFKECVKGTANFE